jgi:hypothetical protein
MNLLPLPPSEIAVRRRAGVVCAVWAVRLLFGWMLGAPLASALIAGGIDQFPSGDALLFEPGGVYLIEAFRTGLPQLVALTRTALPMAGVLAAFGLFPLSVLLVALAHDGRFQLRPFIGRAAAHLPELGLLFGSTLLAQAVVLMGALIGWASLIEPLRSGLPEPQADLLAVLVLLVGLLVAAGIGLVQDVARAAIVRHDLGTFEGVRLALNALARHPRPLLLARLITFTWGITAVTLAAVLVGLLRVEVSSGRALLALLLHQLTVLALVSLRAWWLAQALRHCGSPVSQEF